MTVEWCKYMTKHLMENSFPGGQYFSLNKILKRYMSSVIE